MTFNTHTPELQLARPELSPQEGRPLLFSSQFATGAGVYIQASQNPSVLSPRLRSPDVWATGKQLLVFLPSSHSNLTPTERSNLWGGTQLPSGPPWLLPWQHLHWKCPQPLLLCTLGDCPRLHTQKSHSCQGFHSCRASGNTDRDRKNQRLS